jgi:hypothetical protein
MPTLTSEAFHAERHPEAHIEQLQGVLTTREVANRYGKSYSTVMLAIFKGQIYAEKRDAGEFTKGGIWLVSAASAHALWGEKRTK